MAVAYLMLDLMMLKIESNALNVEHNDNCYE